MSLTINNNKYLGILSRFSVFPAGPIVGGNCDNGSKCGRYLNVNNTAGNARWNIGASPFGIRCHAWLNAPCDINVIVFPQHLLKIRCRDSVSKREISQRRLGYERRHII